MGKWGLFILIILVIPICYASNLTRDVNFCNQEEIIRRINDHTDIQLNDIVDKQLTDKFNTLYEPRKEEFFNQFDNRFNEFKFYGKVFIVSMFGAFLMALTLYALLSYLIKRKN